MQFYALCLQEDSMTVSWDSIRECYARSLFWMEKHVKYHFHFRGMSQLIIFYKLKSSTNVFIKSSPACREHMRISLLSLVFIAIGLLVVDIIQTPNQLFKRSGACVKPRGWTYKEHKGAFRKTFTNVLKLIFLVNKDPLSLSVNDQTCDISHSCVAGCTDILSAKESKGQFSVSLSHLYIRILWIINAPNTSKASPVRYWCTVKAISQHIWIYWLMTERALHCYTCSKTLFYFATDIFV